MRYAIGIALISGALAFCQSSPNHFQLPDKLIGPLANPLGEMDLLTLPRPLSAQPLNQIAPKDSVCAIPLLNALPANGKIDYKIQVLKPPVSSIDRMPFVRTMPVCPSKK